MATKVHMEALSPTMEEGQLVRWLKNEGDTVNEGDVLAEIETDKATMELVARGSGVLRAITLEAGETAPVGEVIAVIAGADEDITALLPSRAGARPAAAERPAEPEPAEAARAEPEEPGDEAAAAVEGVEERRAAAPAQDRAASELQATPAPAAAKAERAVPPAAAAPAAPARATDGDGRIRASPLARRLARESGLDLGTVRGTGPGGRITKADIEAAVARGAAPPEAPEVRAPAAAEPRVAPVPRFEGPDVEEVPASQMRKTIAKRLVTSIGPVPTFYLTREVDMTRTLELRERINQILEKDGIKASINDLIIKAVAAALSLHPEVNASWGENVIYRHRRVHIGVAVAIDDGLITPVIRDADRKRVRDIAVEVRELAGRAREKKLMPDEYTGATFSVSNLGMFGIDEFTAIINPPEGGILAIGKVEDRVVAENGQVVIRPRMRMTMSCDHRVVDGATGARFLQTLVGMLEEPVLMVA